MYYVYFQMFDPNGKFLYNARVEKAYKTKAGAAKCAKKIANACNYNVIVSATDPFVKK